MHHECAARDVLRPPVAEREVGRGAGHGGGARGRGLQRAQVVVLLLRVWVEVRAGVRAAVPRPAPLVHVEGVVAGGEAGDLTPQLHAAHHGEADRDTARHTVGARRHHVHHSYNTTLYHR